MWLILKAGGPARLRSAEPHGRRVLGFSNPPSEPSQSALLIVDDDEDFRRLIVRLLSEGEPRRIDQAATAAEAKASLMRQRYDVVITDLSMPREGGLSLMQWSQANCPGSAWIVLTGHGTLDTAVRALQLGAFDFLEKPLKGAEAVRNSVRNALAHQRLLADRDRLHAELADSNAQLHEHLKELERAYGLLREHADDVRADLQRAGIIQRALLPRVEPELSGVQVHALYRPSQSIGGDLYDVVQVDERWAVLLVADAAGHGLSAALLAVLFRSQLRLADADCRLRHPREMLRAANLGLCKGFPAPGLFVTAVYCLLDMDNRVATIASAGHPALILLRKRGGIERVFHTGPALGLHAEADYAEQEVTLEAGDRLLFYSDGLYDRFRTDEESPSEAVAAALEGETGHGLELLQRLLVPSRAPDPRHDEPLEDDVTLLLLDVTPGRSQFDNGRPGALPTPSTASTDCEILVGSVGRCTTFSILGRAAWAPSAAFHAECAAAIEAGHAVVIDMALCEYLDSTFLGTFHELSQRAEEADAEFRLQGVTPAVEDLFAELGMEGVMGRVVPRMLPLPTQMRRLCGTSDERARALRMLRAHESLAGLSDRNRQEFDPLLAQLRREVAASDGLP
jgi:serine phosphatase RsbU (regulator of sigma subunit)/anti-anti-sigma regulatory factor